MAIEVRRHCKECQSNFTLAIAKKKEGPLHLTCPYCGATIPDPGTSTTSSPVRDSRHPASGAKQQHLF